MRFHRLLLQDLAASLYYEHQLLRSRADKGDGPLDDGESVATAGGPCLGQHGLRHCRIRRTTVEQAPRPLELHGGDQEGEPKPGDEGERLGEVAWDRDRQVASIRRLAAEERSGATLLFGHDPDQVDRLDREGLGPWI